MGLKLVFSVAAVFLVLACAVEARHINQRSHHEEGHSDVPSAGRRPHPGALRGLSHKQARVFPGAVAIKKLVLLKFKKVIPISLILLKSSDDNEAELVPVYPTSEIPANVQFIPTPNGISGHKDVQAIAIPNELHAQLEMNGLANLENIEALLNQAEDGHTDEDSPSEVQMDKEDEPLDIKEDDEDQLLEGVAAAEKPSKATASGLRRLAAEDTSRPGLRSSAPHTSVEEIPLFLYSAKDTPQAVHSGRKSGRRQPVASGRRHYAYE